MLQTLDLSLLSLAAGVPKLEVSESFRNVREIENGND